MATFDFVTDPQVRTVLEDDYRELQQCLDAGAWKAAHVLAGSVIESLLADSLVSLRADKYPLDQVSTMPFDALVAACKDENIISQATVDTAEILRIYGHLLAPDRRARIQEIVGEETAQKAQASMDAIIHEVTERRIAVQGCTSRHLVNKVIAEAPTVDALQQLLRSMKESELEDLLTTIPSRYAEIARSSARDKSAILGPLAVCFHGAFALASRELKARVVRRFVRLVEEDNQEEINAYGRTFFRATHLSYLAVAEQSLVKGYLLSRLNEGDTGGDFLAMLDGVGAFLTTDDVERFANFIYTRVTSQNFQTRDDVENFIAREALVMNKDVFEEMMKLLDRLTRVLGAHSQPRLNEAANRLAELRLSLTTKALLRSGATSAAAV